MGTFAALVDRAEDRVLEMLPYAVPVLRERQGPIEDAFFVLGEAEAERVKAFLDKTQEAVPSLEARVGLWGTLRKNDAITAVASGPARLYYTPKDVDLSIENKETTITSD